MADEDKTFPLPGRYQDCGSFAKGGTARVHLVVDGVLERSVASKICFLPEPEDLERFRHEAQVTAQLDHPNIVPIYDLGDTWFTMKRVHGETLSGLMRREQWGPKLLGTIVDVLLRVCDALAFAHGRGVVHRDVKPENIMIGEYGQVYLMDWGIAVQAASPDQPWAGTASWMAPEQARGEACDARTDVWAVGGLLYFALCGGRPNVGPTTDARVAAAAAGKAPPSPMLVAPARLMPPELVRIAQKALEPEPAKRYPTVLALAADLRAARDQGWWFELRHFAPDEELMREGDDAAAAWLIVSGACEIRQGGGPIAEIGPGEIVGEAALLTGGQRTATVVALTEVVARMITREAMEAELGERAWLGALVRQLASRFHELSLESKERRKG